MKNIPVSGLIKQKRLEKNISVETIFKDIHVPSKYVYMIENGEWDKFPSEVHLKGFLRIYADYLKIDTELVEQCIKDATGDCEKESAGNNPPATRTQRNVYRTEKSLALMVLLAILLIIFYLFILYLLPE